MSTNTNIDRYVKSPDLLADLCREVIARLDARVPDSHAITESAAMEVQLREIAKTIDRLEKMGVPIPDVLRAEKTRLAVVLGEQDATIMALEQMMSSLGAVLPEIRTVLKRRKPKSVTCGEHPERVATDRLPRAVLRSSIINALHVLGGRSSPKGLYPIMEDELKEKFFPGDLVWLEQKKMYAWQRAIENERPNMLRDGVLNSDSPTGTWELSEQYK
jgi:hypothetical protein